MILVDVPYTYEMKIAITGGKSAVPGNHDVVVRNRVPLGIDEDNKEPVRIADGNTRVFDTTHNFATKKRR